MTAPAPTFDRAPITVPWAGRRFELSSVGGLFSPGRLDDGTRLLLSCLHPVDGPTLDLGCGWGALAVPLASTGPVIAVDRDVLAVWATADNAARCGVPVDARASLGLSAVPERGFVQVVSNLPARVGPRGLAHLVGDARARLAPGGALRVVVIEALVPEVVALGGRVVRVGARHAVLELGPGPDAGPDDPYAWTHVADGAGALAVPADINEPEGLRAVALPLLGDRVAGARSALLWRVPYGLLAVRMAVAGARVVVADRDVLSLVFAERNARAAGAELSTLPIAWLPDATGAYDAVIGVLSSGTGAMVARAEVAAAAALAPSDRVWWLCPSRLANEAFVCADGAWGGPERVASTGGWVLMRGADLSPALSASPPSRIRLLRPTPGA